MENTIIDPNLVPLQLSSKLASSFLQSPIIKQESYLGFTQNKVVYSNLKNQLILKQSIKTKP